MPTNQEIIEQSARNRLADLVAKKREISARIDQITRLEADLPDLQAALASINAEITDLTGALPAQAQPPNGR